ncbi:tetraacyldisaccharide 4'-kinase [Rehaibacterium terrae]|uniref:Tetraacyldisaccharide 4'-kinase n=1 Tax=Rehaibacterium terrae TaxID=1341696 RepID=A0A7W7Y192_9GAMM|nr:tetraacyldisaccharide 4'-kinase [Rehaibacterium terrae]
MNGLVDRLQRRWYGGEAPGIGLRLLAAIHAALSALRRAAYLRGWLRVQRLPVPVVVVGNLTVGGAGKTPLIVALGERLRDAGWRPGVVSRGYGRRGREPLTVEADTPATDAGDEPCLIARRTGLPVRVDADRVRAARALVDAGCDLILADDGLQHYRLGRDVEIEVLDGVRRYGNGRLLPAGPLRERPGDRPPCDFRVVNGGEPRDDEWLMLPRLLDARALAGDRVLPLSAFAGRRVHAVAGIGHPARFFEALRRLGIELVEHAFLDHHVFAPHELDFDEPLPLLMTEKDAVKCRDFALPDAWVVPVEAELPDAFYEALLARLDGLRTAPAGAA